MKSLALVPLVLALASSAVVAHEGHDHSHDHDPPVVVDQQAASQPVAVPKNPRFSPVSIKAPLWEQFTGDWKSRWISSETKKTVDGVEDDELLRYRGQWNVEVPTKRPGFEGDAGLVVKTAAAHHAISHKFAEPLDNTGKTLVVQYEVKFQNGLECGGAYMKLLTASDSFIPEKFEDKTPYTIMFGPDKCGYTNKVHLIFRHKNPLSGEFEEKHLKNPPPAKVDPSSHLYTLIVRPDNSFEVLIDNENASKGSLLTEFEPPVNPPKEIEDPEDKKPEDWVEDAKIPDPEAKKPEDWDEDAPFEIVDVDAKKPAGWYDDEPAFVADPDAVKPEDWDDEEDGDWTPPQISNPKCEKAGCGEWKAPMKKNPDYKGKWKAPMIDNPAYKGVWKPRLIPNPKYYEDLTPSNFNKIGALGFELWTMQDEILFDNIYVGNSVEDAKKAADIWAAKFKLEEAANEQVQEDKRKEASQQGPKTSFPKTLDEALKRLDKFVGLAKKDPLEAIKSDYVVSGALGAVFSVPLFIALSFLFGGSPKPEKPKKAKKVKKEDDDEKEEEEAPKKSEKSESGAKKRNKKKAAAAAEDD
ncbi:calnexin, partial [Cladochytrium replicatum]